MKRPSPLGVVARQEIVDAFRSRRVISVLVMYFAGAVAACALFVFALHRIENQLVEAFGLSVSAEGGNVTRTLWQSDHFRHMLGELVGDREVAARLLNLPPLGIFYGWLAFQFTPLLVILMASPRLAEDIGSGAVRFILVRADRSTWCLGTYLGQAGLLALALLGSAAGVWIVGVGWMQAFEPIDTAWAAVQFAVRAWFYGLPFLGLAMGLSCFARSGVVATGVALVGLTAMAIVTALAGHYRTDAGWRRLLDIVYQLAPGGHKPMLWVPDASHLVPAFVMLAALGAIYLGMGYAWLGRRDL